MNGTSTVFDRCFEVLLGHEGGYVNNPADPGGATNWGISQKSYPHLDIRTMTREQAKALYWTDYWEKAGCPYCHPALALVVFDSAVNNGVSRAIRCLQEGLGVTVDGVLGQETMAALASVVEPDAVLSYTHGARIRFMASLTTWGTFGRGWSRRLALIPYQAAVVAQSVGSL